MSAPGEELVALAAGLANEKAAALRRHAADLHAEGMKLEAEADALIANAKAKIEKARAWLAHQVAEPGPLGRVPVQTPAMLAPASHAVDSRAAVAVPSEVTQ